MFENCKGKKLLLIGVEENESLTRAAHEMGVYVILIDRNASKINCLSKSLADEVWEMDYSDIDAVVKKCRENGVGGVMAGYSEFKVASAQKVAEALGTPFYATAEQIELTRNKRTFKDMCEKYDIPTPRDYRFTKGISEEDKKHIVYPVIIKPTDYAGCKGISVCHSESELDEAVRYALEYSVSQTIICEQYLVGVEFAAIYTIVDGVASLSCLNDKFISRNDEGFAGRCALVFTPSKYYGKFMETVDGKIKTFLKGIGAQNGVAFFQGIANDESIHVFEMGYRLNGNNDCTIIEKFNNINFMKMLISHSLTGSMGDDISKDNPQFSEYSISLCFRLHRGVVKTIDYSKIFEDPNVLDAHCYITPGTEIVNENTSQSRGLLVKFKAPTLEDVEKTIKSLQSKVFFLNEKGENMLFDGFDTKLLYERYGK